MIGGRWLSGLMRRRGDPPRLLLDGLLLRPPRETDFPTWSALRQASRIHLAPWEPLWPEDDLTFQGFRRRLKQNQDELHQGVGCQFLIFSTDETQLYGGITLSNIRRRAAQSATIGYWMGAPHIGKGLMTHALNGLCLHAFSTLDLKRVEAACLPENAASIRVLEKAGFTREGLARAYLNIAGQRRDHLLFARLADDTLPCG